MGRGQGAPWGVLCARRSWWLQGSLPRSGTVTPATRTRARGSAAEPPCLGGALVPAGTLQPYGTICCGEGAKDT